MSRPSVGGAFETKLSGAVTQPGYLLEIEFSTTVRWSTRGTLTWNSQTWVGREFKVQMSGGRGMDAKLTLTLLNNDNAIGTLCLADGVGNRNIRLWKFTGNAPSLTDCSQIFGGIGDTFSLTKRRVTIQAVPKGMEVIKEPSLRIVRNAVRAELTPAGTRVPWNGEIFILQN